MQSKRNMRAVCGASTFFASIATVVACTDLTRPERNGDDASADVQTTLQVQSQLQVYAAGRPLLAAPVSASHTETRWSYAVRPPSSNPLFSKSAATPQTKIHHHREANGDVYSTAVVFDAGGKPPKRLYAFKNGRIQIIYHPRYKRAGNMWIRQHATVMTFGDDGKPIARVDLETKDEVQVGSRFHINTRTFASDALAAFGRSLLPAPLLAEGIEDGPCSKALTDVLAKEFTTGGAAIVALYTANKCRVVTPLNEAICTTLLGLLGSGVSQFNALVDSMDALIRCDFYDWLRVTNTPTAGSGSGSQPPPTAPAPADATNVKLPTVREFIEEAERNGTFWCETADKCFYYAE